MLAVQIDMHAFVGLLEMGLFGHCMLKLRNRRHWLLV